MFRRRRCWSYKILFHLVHPSTMRKKKLGHHHHSTTTISTFYYYTKLAGVHTLPLLDRICVK